MDKTLDAVKRRAVEAEIGGCFLRAADFRPDAAGSSNYVAGENPRPEAGD